MHLRTELYPAVTKEKRILSASAIQVCDEINDDVQPCEGDVAIRVSLERMRTIDTMSSLIWTFRATRTD